MSDPERREAAARVSIGIEVALDPEKAFDVLIEELAIGLRDVGITLDPGPDGTLREGHRQVGRVIAWAPGQRVELQWRQADWNDDEVTEVEFRFEPLPGGTRVTIEHSGWGRQLGGGEEIAGWFARRVASPFLAAMAPAGLGDWITDRRARRPSGAQARAVYADPLYHYPAFRVILEELALTPDDYLVEVGCGGGALLKDVLESGCRAAAVDHSFDMVELARDANREAVTAGTLEVREARADRLPFDDETFTCAAMSGVLGFLPDPVAAFREIHRVLEPGGRLVGLGSDAKLKGTPAAPEPMASRLRFYSRQELAALAREAGFEDVRVVRRDLEAFAREAGVPAEHLPLFTGEGEQFLLARKRG